MGNFSVGDNVYFIYGNMNHISLNYGTIKQIIQKYGFEGYGRYYEITDKGEDSITKGALFSVLKENKTFGDNIFYSKEEALEEYNRRKEYIKNLF